MKNKKIVIAGASGFLGRAVVLQLRSAGYKNLVEVSGAKFDLTKLDNCLRVTRNAALVINSAGFVVSRVRQNLEQADVIYRNIMIDLQLLEACRRNRVPMFLSFGSVTAYATNVKKPLREKDLFSGSVAIAEEGNFYGIAKWFSVVSALAYSKQCPTKIRIVVFPNLYGPGDKFDEDPPPLVPSLIRKIYEARKRGEKIFMAGNNQNMELSLLYIDDAADMAIKVVNNFGEEPFICVNAGPAKVVKISEICQLVAEAVGFSGRVMWNSNNKDTTKIYMSSLIARRRFGWKPYIGLRKGIGKTVAWFIKEYVRKK